MRKVRFNAQNRIVISVLMILFIFISSVSAEGIEKAIRLDKETESTALPSRFRPVLIVAEYSTGSDSIIAGDNFEVIVTLKNTSLVKYVANIVIRIDTDDNDLKILENTNMIYVDRIEKGANYQFSIKCQAARGLKRGSYPVNIYVSYDDNYAMTYTLDDTIPVYVETDYRVEMDFDDAFIDITSGEVLPLDISVENLSRDMVYNVRFEVEVDGLRPLTSLYIGNMEGGTGKLVNMKLLSTYLKDENRMYGISEGKIVLIYETEEGEERRVEKDYSIDIEMPSEAEKKEDEKSVDLKPYIYGAVAVFMIVGIIFLVLVYRQRIIRR